MSLQPPNLDDRKFQEIVDDVKRQISLRCPEWTEHNVSDPGVTLLELFAQMTEMMLFRMNQVPEKNYLKFLEMIGIGLEPKKAAETELLFNLSAAIEDDENAQNQQIIVQGKRTIVGTLRTEAEPSIDFALNGDLVMVRPKLGRILLIGSDQKDLDGCKDFKEFGVDSMTPTLVDEELQEYSDEDDERNGQVSSIPGFKIFGDPIAQGNALYISFLGDISCNVVQLQTECFSAKGSGLNVDYPSQLWEYWKNATLSWERLRVLTDSTYGFNHSGNIDLELPPELQPRIIAGSRAIWVRCRYTSSPEDLPPIGISNLTPSEYSDSPSITSLKARTVGGVAAATHCVTVLGEKLGISDGLPGQMYRVRNWPTLALGQEECILVGPEGATLDYTNATAWTLVDDFSSSSASDRHFTFDTLTGEVAFGPNIDQPGGEGCQHGAVPQKGFSVVMKSYRHGGGSHGNVRPGVVYVPKHAIPFIAEVTNPRPARGGADQESVERAKMRALKVLKVRNRAVTAEDFEFLAKEASNGVGRARCVQPINATGRPDLPLPGTVLVLLTPVLSPLAIAPSAIDLRVDDKVKREVGIYLTERKLITTQLRVEEPEYIFVSVEVKLVADPKADAEAVAKRVSEKLYSYIHPLWGGPNESGWPYGRTLTLADVYAQVGSVFGVAFLLDAKMFKSTVSHKDLGLLGSDELVLNVDGVQIEEHQLLASKQHRVRVVPMAMVGLED